MGSRHRLKPVNFRPEPSELADVLKVLGQRQRTMEGFLRACLRWAAADPQAALAILQAHWPAPRPTGRPPGSSNRASGQPELAEGDQSRAPEPIEDGPAPIEHAAGPADDSGDDGGLESDRDELFDLLADLAAELRGEIGGELGAALADPAEAFLSGWERQAGDGDLSEVTQAAWQVLDVLAGYRHVPTTPTGLNAVAERLIDRLPVSLTQDVDAGPATPPDADPGEGPEPDEALMVRLRALLTGGRPVSEAALERLHHEVYLLTIDGRRAGWVDHDGTAWRIHTEDAADQGLDRIRRPGGFGLAQVLADALHTTITLGNVRDHRDRALDLDPSSLATWSLLRGRAGGREDVVVRGRCVGWLQRDRAGRYVACTLDGPVPDSAGTTKVQTVMALFAVLYAPAPLPDLPPEVRTPRRAKARSGSEKPLSPYTEQQLAAAAHNPPRQSDGSYLVAVDHYGEQVVLGSVRRAGRRWTAANAAGRGVALAGTRTQAIDRLLAVPGPLFADPADAVVHGLSGR